MAEIELTEREMLIARKAAKLGAFGAAYAAVNANCTVTYVDGQRHGFWGAAKEQALVSAAHFFS